MKHVLFACKKSTTDQVIKLDDAVKALGGLVKK